MNLGTPVNLVIMVILSILAKWLIGKMADSHESVDLGESVNSGDCSKSDYCCESYLILVTLQNLVVLVNITNLACNL